MIEFSASYIMIPNLVPYSQITYTLYMKWLWSRFDILQPSSHRNDVYMVLSIFSIKKNNNIVKFRFGKNPNKLFKFIQNSFKLIYV